MDRIAHESLPRHKRLYELLRRDILEGRHEPGNLLPSENELCALHHVTRPTVRQALFRLESEGFIKKHQGKGSIVQPVPKGIGILSIHGTTLGIGPHNLETRPSGRPVIASWPQDFPFLLNNEERSSGCIKLERRRIVDGQAVLYEISYLPNKNMEGFTRRSFVNKSLFDVLRNTYKIEVKGGNQRIRAIEADKTISCQLDISPGDAILCLQRVLETNRHDFRFFSVIYCNTTNFYLEGSF